MIRFALKHVDLLTVLICCSDNEPVPPHVRKSWIEKTFQNVDQLEIRTYTYLESDLPNTSVTSREVTEKWATVFRQLLPDFSLVVTSEPYGDILAEVMNIRHLLFDMDRKLFQVSASGFMANRVSNWRYLPEAVKSDYSIKVVILGTESTGKTILTQELSKHYRCSMVSEVGRDLIPSSSNFSINDLENVAKAHAERISRATRGESALVIIDTDVHITMSYAQFAFSKKMSVSDEGYDINKAHLYLYLNNDVPHVQDGTRLNEADRNLLDTFHRQVLKDHKIDVQEVSGNWDERFDKAVILIDKLLASMQKK